MNLNTENGSSFNELDELYCRHTKEQNMVYVMCVWALSKLANV